MEQKRNSNVEVLRLVLMLAIFAWHILVHGYGFKDVAQSGMALTGKRLTQKGWSLFLYRVS